MAATEDSFRLSCRKCGSSNRVPAAKEGLHGRCGNCGDSLPPLYFRPVPLGDGDFDLFTKNYDQLILAEFWAPW